MSTFAPSLTRGHAALRGALATILGIVFIVWPGITIGTAVVLFAIYCVSDAVMQFSNVLGGDEGAAHRVVRVLVALVDVAAAAVAIIWPGPTAAVLVIVIGVWAIFGGFAEVWGAFSLRSGWLGVTGVLSIATGILLVAWPGIGAVSLAIVVGAYLATYGVVLLLSAAKAPSGQRVGDPVTGA